MRDRLRLLRFIDHFNEWMGRCIAGFVVIMMAATVYEVGARYLFDKPTIWAQELTVMLFGAFFVLGGGYVTRHDAHVRADILYSRISPRQKLIVDSIAFALLLVMCGLIIWKGLEMSQIAWKYREVSDSLWAPPIYPLKFTIPVGAGLVLIQGITNYIRQVVAAKAGQAVAVAKGSES